MNRGKYSRSHTKKEPKWNSRTEAGQTSRRAERSPPNCHVRRHEIKTTQHLTRLSPPIRSLHGVIDMWRVPHGVVLEHSVCPQAGALRGVSWGQHRLRGWEESVRPATCPDMVLTVQAHHHKWSRDTEKKTRGPGRGDWIRFQTFHLDEPKSFL